jgi:thiol:disulfide interchange protein DsbD
MKRLAISFLFTLLAGSAFSQSGLVPANGGIATPPVELSGGIEKRNGDEVQGTVLAKIPDTWHINSSKPLDEYAIPTTLTLDAATAELVSAQFPPHEVKSFTFSAGAKVAVYQGTIRIPFTAKLKPGVTSIKASLHYQACNDKVCLPPRNATAEISTNLVPAAAPIPNTGAPASFTPLSAAPPAGTAAAAPASTDRLASTFASSGMPLTLLVLFVLGMALNLTPCVFPMIPITVGFFAMQSDGRRGRRFALSALYVLGIVIMYSSLGVVASLSGKMFGAWLQHPSVQVGFAALMVLLATSMFGAFDIGVPKFIANRAQGRAGFAGALTMGLLVGIVAAPCVGPVVVSLIGLVASIGKPSIGFVMFAALALGLGFPYLIMLNALPRPGVWMVHVKKSMGFVLVAMAFYFLRPLIGDLWFQYGVAASLLIGAIFLFFLSARSQGARALRLSCAALLLVAGVAFAIPHAKGKEVAWARYDAKLLADASAAKQPVVIDFYADWCLPCKELDAKTFSDPKVAAELGRFTRVKADLTRPEDPQTQALTKQYGIVGVPTIVFVDSNGQERKELRLTGYEDASKFLDRIAPVR